MSSSTEWPEFESTTLTKSPEWTLRTESELHVERLEAKLDNLKKKKNSRLTRAKQVDSIQPQEQIDLDAEEIQQDEQEADEGLWLLWNNPSSSTTQVLNETSTLLKNPTQNSSHSYGASSTGTIFPPQSDESENQDQNQEEDREERLENAKANAKHVQEYLREDTCYSRSCCCTIM